MRYIHQNPVKAGVCNKAEIYNYSSMNEYLVEPNIVDTDFVYSLITKEQFVDFHKEENFDKCLEDEFWGEQTWKKAESKILKETVNTLFAKSGLSAKEIDYCFAGDLLNQCISSSFGLRETNIPFFGVFGACSTFAESMCLGSLFVASGAANNILCATSSHFCSAEKQFRFPLELGNQRPPSSQWTVTGAGCSILSKKGNGPYITGLTPGKIVDKEIKDANNMGAAMAPAAADTIYTHLKDMNKSPAELISNDGLA